MRGIPCRSKCAADRVAGEEKWENLVVAAGLLRSLDPTNRKLLEDSERGDGVSWGRAEGHIKQIKSYSLIKGHLLMLCASYRCFRKGGKSNLPRSVKKKNYKKRQYFSA